VHQGHQRARAVDPGPVRAGERGDLGQQPLPQPASPWTEVIACRGIAGSGRVCEPVKS
jgi:hypothetical protein